MTPRCEWCGRFGASPVTRELRIYDHVYQPTGEWRSHTQPLCPECASSWSKDLPWNRAAVAVVENDQPDSTDLLLNAEARRISEQGGV